ncbi:Agroclavine dehydrogenase [Psilocybe cubensis]|uniref:NAD(P)-binding domain-containing protein n=2 Tax=Psilocybe cubensis TaxID=181762 RepID=A0A8H8CI22_PSICU|nr:Agroclavine dehydrogenase [Psilocybe cubensis]KAH9475911.1 Agroclavine dehydrogenase [Psilocybe cubensis]
MTTLITGGTGRSGLSLAKLLRAAGRPVVIASRAGTAPEPFKAVKFEWYDASTYEGALSDASIDRVYVVGPPGRKESAMVIDFIEFAISKGVKRFVLMSAAPFEPKEESPIPAMVIHKYLLDKGVDYVVLRPTWFIENFGSNFLASIRDNNEIFSAAPTGLIPWISTEDVAQAAFEALTAEPSPNKDIIIVGPELHSYPDAAKIATEVLGRPIVYKEITVEEHAARYAKAGLDPDFSKVLAGMDKVIEAGTEESYFKDQKLAAEGRKYVGTRTLRQYFQDNKALWSK